MNRVEAITQILDNHPEALVIISNGLTSREAAHFQRRPNCFYLLHGMGEALAVGVGAASAAPDREIVVIDGDGNALMGMSSWSMMTLPNVTYYVLRNGMYETTGGQSVPAFPALPNWCKLVEIDPGKNNTPNPPLPEEILKTNRTWLESMGMKGEV